MNYLFYLSQHSSAVVVIAVDIENETQEVKYIVQGHTNSNSCV